jgi:DNA repair exonuclease SbcCD nuclease subunit
MKVVILGDTHFGVRNGSKSFNEYFERFYNDVFFPYLINNNIKKVIQLGDIFDNRKLTHLTGFSEYKRYFFDKFTEYDIELNVLVGNHDSAYKNTIEVNSPHLLLEGKYPNVKVFSKPELFEVFPGMSVLMLPWICSENYDETMELVNQSKTDFCFGHLELSNFMMYKGLVSDHGMNPELFSKFEFVFTGHYHHKSNRGNIYYLGTPYELTWSDASDPKGFHVFDFETRELNFIQNPYKMFNKLYYDDLMDEDLIKQIIEENELESLRNSYVKVIVKNKENPYLFDLLLTAIDKVEPIDVTPVEEIAEVLSEEIDDINETEDTLTILGKYVDNIKSKDIDSTKLKTILTTLYNDAVSLEII